jgi:hypothetical protein
VELHRLPPRPPPIQVEPAASAASSVVVVHHTHAPAPAPIIYAPTVTTVVGQPPAPAPAPAAHLVRARAETACPPPVYAELVGPLETVPQPTPRRVPLPAASGTAHQRPPPTAPKSNRVNLLSSATAPAEPIDVDVEAGGPPEGGQ